MNTAQMTARGKGHTQLRDELDSQGLLHDRERETLMAAADALLFDEPDAGDRLKTALELIDRLEANDRRTANEADKLRTALEMCAVTVVGV